MLVGLLEGLKSVSIYACALTLWRSAHWGCLT